MAHSAPYNPIVLNRKTVFMQRLADYVRLGYREYVLGEVRADRALALAAKFQRLYEVHLHRNHRARARANGEASAYAVWWQPHADTIVFALLLTPGRHAVRQLEKLQDATERDARLAVGDYELVQRPRADKASPAWTWRLTEAAYEGWRERTLEVVKGGNTFVVRQHIDDLMSMPGFAGIREQVKKLKSLFRSEWTRRRKAQDMPTLPRQRFVQRLESKGVRLRALTTTPRGR